MAAGSANANTINTADATCISCSMGVTTGTTPGGIDFVAGVQADDSYRLESPDFLDGNNNAFDAIVEVLALAPGMTNEASSINVRGVNNWMHLRYSFVEAGTNISTILEDISFVNVFDVDSNFGVRSRDDFTDVVGVDKPIANLGAALENAGFIQPGAPAMNYARLDQEFIPGNGWRNEPNYTPTSGFNELDFVASFGTAGVDLETFELVWGSTGAASNNVRGFDVRLSANSAAVPVPAAAFLFAPAMGLAAWRTRKAK